MLDSGSFIVFLAMDGTRGMTLPATLAAGLEMLRSYNWDIPEQIMARPDYYNDGTLQALMQESAELISVMAAEQEQKVGRLERPMWRLERGRIVGPGHCLV